SLKHLAEPVFDGQELYEVLCSGNEQLLAETMSSAGMPIGKEMPITPVVVQGVISSPFWEDIQHVRFRMNKRRVGILVYSHQIESALSTLDLSNSDLEYSIGIGPSTENSAELEATLE